MWKKKGRLRAATCRGTGFQPVMTMDRLEAFPTELELFARGTGFYSTYH
jgi:hypothetical protein